MAPRADLTGQQISGWTVLRKAPAQNRVAFWTATHDACGIVTDLPHVTLVKAQAGKSGLAACTTCVPADERRNIDHGMHLACGTAHLLGTACPDGVQREPGPDNSPSNRVPATSQDFPAYPNVEVAGGPGCIIVGLPSIWASFDEAHAEDAITFSVTEYAAQIQVSRELAAENQAFAEAVEKALEPAKRLYYGHPSENAPAAEPEPAAQLADAETGAVVIHGRVDRLEEPQAVLDVIRRAIVQAPRSQQDALGPSEYGGCERKLGHRLALGKQERDPDSAWRPQVGTAVHAWLAEVFGAVFEGDGRWLSDFAVTAPVAGTLDLFDRDTGRVIDFKVSGETVRNKAAKGEVSERYETQLDLYGLGMIAAGYHVESVALLFLPPAGSLSEAVWYSRPFDPSRALASIERHNRVKVLVDFAAANDLAVEKVLDGLSTSEDYCQGCPALGKYCKGAETAWIPGGLPDSAWPAYDAAVKALGGAA